MNQLIKFLSQNKQFDNLMNNNQKINFIDYVFCTKDNEFYTPAYSINANTTLGKVFTIVDTPIHLANEIEIILYSKDYTTCPNGSVSLVSAELIFGEDI